AFPGHRSDESSCAEPAQKRMTRNTMTNTETTDKAAAVAEQGATVAPEKAPSKKATSQKKAAPKGKKNAKGGNAKAAAKKAVAPKKEAKASKKAKPAPAKKESGKGERSNKKAEVIAMMKRAKGVTLAEIAEFTGWQKHTIRGFVSILGSKGGEKIESSKNEAGDRVYRIAK
ncbi:MAG: DUF3489 domain-containing protein, partial [Bryobacteraceae bacterium]